MSRYDEDVTIRLRGIATMMGMPWHAEYSLMVGRYNSTLLSDRV